MAALVTPARTGGIGSRPGAGTGDGRGVLRDGCSPGRARGCRFLIWPYRPVWFSVGEQPLCLPDQPPAVAIGDIVIPRDPEEINGHIKRAARGDQIKMQPRSLRDALLYS